MRRWVPWLAVPIGAGLAILSARGRAPAMLEDTDTSVLLAAIRERRDPLSWFWGDWPLGNHFYRPVSTLTFELDDRLGQGAAAQFGWTNAWLAALCVAALFWLARELTESPPVAAGAAGLFGLWHFVGPGEAGLAALLGGAAWGAFVGLLRSGWRHLGPVLLGFASMAFLAYLVEPVVPLGPRIVGWLPGRTASTMTLLALVSLAAMARFERLTAPRLPAPPPTARDLPATKGTLVARPGRWEVLWAPASLLSAALALGCYEQAVMLPAGLLAVSLWWRLARARPRWGWTVGAFALLAVYLLLRSLVVPTEASGYQRQQFRDGPGVAMALWEYALPGVNGLRPAAVALSSGLVVLVTSSFWAPAMTAVSNLGAVVAVGKDRRGVGVSVVWGMAFLAFLPMAWLKPFEHYHYWPSALRALAVALFAPIAFWAWLNAVSPPGRRAPPRRSPAPGSLPRP